jgi:hypothetical protein
MVIGCRTVVRRDCGVIRLLPGKKPAERLVQRQYAGGERDTYQGSDNPLATEKTSTRSPVSLK